MEYEAVIGLEVHAQLSTRSKMFCACPVTFGAAPNSQVCPVCLGHPGALPVANLRAVELAVQTGLALGARVHPVSAWARKNYFYPDLPKGYQITQYEHPLITGGTIEVGGHAVAIRRMHLEEDAGMSRHPETEGEQGTLVDLNRCGTPLLEIVSEPDLQTPEEARCYMESLRQILRFLGVCKGDMECGNLRCDANLSIRPRGEPELGVKTEIKNLNSLRNLQRALTAEFERQRRCPESVVPATLLFDQVTGETRPMRSKEAAQDYRYFPEPDLPPLNLDAAWIDRLAARLPELPAARRRRMIDRYGLRSGDARRLTASPGLADYFERTVAAGADPRRTADFMASVLLRVLGECGIEIEEIPVAPSGLYELLDLMERGDLGGAHARAALGEMMRTGRRAADLAAEHGWEVSADPERLRAWAAGVLADHPEQVAAFRSGKRALLGFFMGRVMQASGGRAHPQQAQAMLLRLLNEKAGHGGGTS